MDELKHVVRQGFKTVCALLLSPIIGAIETVKSESKRPKATNWKQFIVNDIRMFFAPLTGAVAGLAKALSNRKFPRR